MLSMTIADIVHPNYELRYREWEKWRDTYIGGLDFKLRYLKPFSGREGDRDFENRQEITPVPAFAKTGLNEIRNSIYQRMCHVNRVGGTPTYMEAVKGLNGGVNQRGSSMNAFIGQQILKELMIMSRVGVFVDMPQVKGPTLADMNGARPYLYMYRAEDIRSWNFDENTNLNEFQAILLKDSIYTYDPETNLVNGTGYRYRHLYVQDGQVMIQFYDSTGAKIGLDGNKDSDFPPIPLKIKKIPFVLFEISDSLMTDIADYQIGLLNLESSDLAFILRSNFPFYTEQYDPLVEGLFIRGPGENQTGESVVAQQAKDAEIKVGISQGRRYPKDLERPQFIAPPSEPLKLSMDKQERMKANIRELLHLSLANLTPTKASATGTVPINQGTAEGGLSYIGLELECGERKIAEYWAMMEGRKEVASVKYPEIYTLKSEDERHKEIDQDSKMVNVVPSITFKREICKRLARNLLGPYADDEILIKIDQEIDKADFFESDWQAINKDVESGIVDYETAALARGYPADKIKEIIKQAAKDHTERLARIAEAQAKHAAAPGMAPVGGNQPPQAGARGVKEQTAPQNKEGIAEKSASQDKTISHDNASKTRGKGANTKV